MQEAFLRLASNENRDAIGNPVSYLYRVVRNIALDGLRRDKVERREEQQPQWWLLPSAPVDPEQATSHASLIARIETALEAMEPRMRLALELHRFEGYTLQEIADRTGSSAPTVHRLVRDALVRIAMVMEEQA